MLHCAASISFDLPLPEARAINVDGTSRVLDFAIDAQARGGLERFLHVSTAYVSGRHEGAFRERQLDTGQSFRNTYEQTKADAEQIVAMARELGPAIARPSIVMGESDSGWTPAFNVLYWPLQAFSRGLFKELPALPTGRVDIVPVDYVADSLVHLLDRREAGVFNLVAGRNASTVDELTTLASEYFNKPRAAVRRADRSGRQRRPRLGLRARTSTCGSSSTTPAPAPCWCPRASRRRRSASTSAKLMEYAADRQVGQEEAHARGRAGALRGARRHLSSKASRARVGL